MKNYTIIFVVALISALVSTFALGCIITREYYEKALKQADTVYIEKWLPQPVPEPTETTPVEPMIVYLPKPYPVRDTITERDTTIVKDSVLVEVPIVEKSYASSNYHLTIRGFQPELVDIWIKQQEKIITVPYQKRWSFTVGPQAGYGITPQGLQPYAGVGITFGYSF